MKWTAKKRLQSVVGLTLTDGQLQAFQMARTKGAITCVKSTSAALVLDVMHPEPELVGREIRNQLEAAGIRERHCVVGLPPAWIMTQQTALPPQLSAEDESSFLQIEAEKGFPCDPSQLQIARSRLSSGAAVYVTQLGVRTEQLEHLAAVLKGAGLKPVGISLGLATLPEVMTSAGSGRITAVLQPKGATVLVASGGGIAAFRTCESSIESDGGENVLNGAAVMRELRVTLEQLSPDLRQEVREVRLCGDERMVESLSSRASEWARTSGLTLAGSTRREPDVNASIAQNLAAHWLQHDCFAFEFLIQRPGRWASLMARYSSRRLATAGFAVGALAAVALAAFGWQEFRRWSLRSTWSGMQAEVTQLHTVQGRITEYRPWFDSSYRNLSVIRRITESFPENGTVTAKTLEIKANGQVSVTGTARDHAALLRTLEQLGKNREVQGLNLEQIRGKSPAQYTFTFRWNANTGS